MTQQDPLPQETPSAPPPAAVSDLMRTETRALHTEAERSGIVREILQGRIGRRAYALYLRNLLPAYGALEDGLDAQRHRRGDAGAGRLAQQPVYRAARIRADLSGLCGPDYASELSLLPEGRAYADEVAAGAAGDGAPLVGHAYTRYLGDLNGGRIIFRQLSSRPDFMPAHLTFHQFGPDAPADSLRHTYRQAIDDAGRDLGDDATIVAAAITAFRLNIALSVAVQRSAAAAA